jgi:two-component system nitrate/nitrite response regulator NarL
MNITLTQREHDVLLGLMMGKTNKAIAAELDTATDTVKVHVKTILLKLGVKTRTEAAIKVMRAAVLLPCPKCGYIDPMAKYYDQP